MGSICASSYRRAGAVTPSALTCPQGCCAQGELHQSGRLSLIQADARQLPLSDGSVDAAMAMHMLYHVPSVPAAIRELRRMTRPGGTVLASTISSGSLAEIFGLLDAAISRQLGRPVMAMPALSFTT